MIDLTQVESATPYLIIAGVTFATGLLSHWVYALIDTRREKAIHLFKLRNDTVYLETRKTIEGYIDTLKNWVSVIDSLEERGTLKPEDISKAEREVRDFLYGLFSNGSNYITVDLFVTIFKRIREMQASRVNKANTEEGVDSHFETLRSLIIRLQFDFQNYLSSYLAGKRTSRLSTNDHLDFLLDFKEILFDSDKDLNKLGIGKHLVLWALEIRKKEREEELAKHVPNTVPTNGT